MRDCLRSIFLLFNFVVVLYSGRRRGKIEKPSRANSRRTEERYHTRSGSTVYWKASNASVFLDYRGKGVLDVVFTLWFVLNSMYTQGSDIGPRVVVF